jgi:hypothetical protein
MTGSMRRILAAALVAWAAAAGPALAGKEIVIELFTSQGCSSCPPADALLAELAKRPGVIALSHHVDYWNYLGWTDPFATAGATARQHAYRERFDKRFVYTPQMVIDGAAECVGSERETVAELIGKAERGSRSKLAVVVEQPSRGTLRITLPAGPAPEKPATVWLAFYSEREMTTVAGGENRGVVITNANVVRAMRKVGTWRGGAQTIVVQLAETAPQQATGCAAMVQVGEVGPILGAAALALSR